MMSVEVDKQTENNDVPKEIEEDAENKDNSKETEEEVEKEENIEEVEKEENQDKEEKPEDSTGSNKQKIQVSARVRRLLPWEDPLGCIEFEDKALGVTKNSTSIIGERIVNFYQFDEVFEDNKENQDVFDELCKPLCETTLNKGYNSIMIAYGQTGSGKTYTMLGKKNENVVGVLPMCLQYFLNDDRVEKITMQAVEVYGVSTQKIAVFDLLDAENINNRKWQDKKAINNRVADLHSQFITHDIENRQQTIDLVQQAQQASHFAPTGKNPQSSRGHVAFIITIKRTDKIVSNFVAVDLAGSEGESALTASFAKKVSKKILKTRRLEAGIINYGLSQLQKILQEIRKKKSVSEFKESGLRRVLHPYINQETYISVLFTLSPSNTNIKSTRSTLRTANVVSMIEIIPKTIVHEPTKEEIIVQLNKTVKEQRQYIAMIQKQWNEAKETSAVANEKLIEKEKTLEKQTAELNEMRETEKTMIRYADTLKRQLSDNQELTETELEETRGKLDQIEKELEELKKKEAELDELNEAIDTAINEHGNDTVVDDVKTDEIEKSNDFVPEIRDTRAVSMKFTTLIEDKEKHLAELTEKLQHLENIEETAKAKDETITQQMNEIQELQAKLDEIQNADDIQLDIDMADEPENKNDEPDQEDKDAKIAELEKRCQELQEKNPGCACIVM